MDAFKSLLPSIQKLSNNLERAAIANDLAGYIGVDPGPGPRSIQKKPPPSDALLLRKPRPRPQILVSKDFCTGAARERSGPQQKFSPRLKHARLYYKEIFGRDTQSARLRIARNFLIYEVA